MDIETGRHVFVGRARELAVLRAGMLAARQGQGGVILVSGPAGIGKSRLVAEAVRGVPGVLRGRCLADGGAPPLWPWLRILGRGRIPAGSLPAGPPADVAVDPSESAAARFGLLVQLCDGLVSAAEASDGLVVVLEDLHDADEASLALLRLIAMEVAQARLLIIGTHRDTTGQRAAALAATIADLARSAALQNAAVHNIALTPLTAPDVAAFLAAGGADIELADRLLEYTGGLPLLVASMTRSLRRNQPWPDPSAGLPPLPAADLTVLVAELLGGLEAAVRDSAEVAAVLGADLDPQLLADVRDLPVEEMLEHLDALMTAGLLSPCADGWPRYRFVHSLIRDRIVRSVPAAAAWHRRAAAAVESRMGSDSAQAARIAAHWARAGGDAMALRATVRWMRAAAAHALRILAPQDASQYLQQALIALDQLAPGPDERAEIFVELARAEYLAGQIPDAIGHLRAGAAGADAADRPDLLTAAALVINGAGDPEILAAAAALCDRALSAVDAASGVDAAADPPAFVVARARLNARKACLDVEADVAVDHAASTQRALRLAESCGDRTALLDATRARVGALVRADQAAERLRLGDMTVRIAREARYPMAAVRGHTWRIDAAYQLVDIVAADEAIGRLAELASSTAIPAARWFYLRVSAAREALAGRFDRARSESESAGALAVRMGDPVAIALTEQFAGLLALVRGDRAELAASTESTPQSVRQMPLIRVAHALHLHLLGEPQDAKASYEHLRLRLRQPVTAQRGLGMLQYLTELVEAFDDVEAAGWAYTQWLPWAAAGGLPGSAGYFCGGSPARAIGRMAARLGRLDEAEAALRAAAAINTQLDAQPWLTHTWLELAQVLRRHGGAGRLSEAATLAGRAAAQARRLDQPGPLARADKLLADVITQRRIDDPLTAREREVASLVAQAISNRQIADRLSLSERTVESHVHNILIKLGLTNRTEMTAYLLSGSHSG